MKAFRMNVVLAIAISMVLPAALFAQNSGNDDTFTEPTTKREFPAKIEFEYSGKKYTLEATGAAASVRNSSRSKKAARYILAHYMEKYDAGNEVLDFYDEVILKPNVVKQITLEFNVEIMARQIENSMGKMLDRTSRDSDYADDDLQTPISRLLKAIGRNYAPGDQLVFRWLPEGKLQLTLPDGKEEIFSEKNFARFFWHSWFGLMSPVDRNSLVDRIRKY